MLSLSDFQLAVVMAAAARLPIQTRDDFLRCIAEQLEPRTVDIQDAIARAMRHVSAHSET